MLPGETNVAYICSRYYRAPELILGATDYSIQIGLSNFVIYLHPQRTLRCLCLYECLSVCLDAG